MAAAPTLNGLDAYIGLYQGSIQGVGDVIMRAAHIVHGRQVYVFAGFAPRDQFDHIDGRSTTASQTFRPLTAREADDDSAQPPRLLHRARRATPGSRLPSRGGGLVRASDLAIMNNHEVSDQPQAGRSHQDRRRRVSRADERERPRIIATCGDFASRGRARAVGSLAAHPHDARLRRTSAIST